jgi:hypothetical protein
MKTAVQTNRKLPRRIPIKWDSLDSDWQPVAIRLFPTAGGQAVLWQRVWQYLRATIGDKEPEPRSNPRASL